MKSSFFTNMTLITVLAAVIVSCGPETNSRYGDKYWDPNKTKAKFDPIEVPDYVVTYREVTPDVDYDAYIAMDFSKLDRESKDGVVIAYARGISGEKDIADLLQANSSFTDGSFLNDIENAVDYRLSGTQAGKYTITLDFDVIWPNGNTVSYLMDDIKFTVPGCQQNYDFYSDYINPVIAENCVNCHNAGDASTAFDLDASSTTTRRDSFLSKIIADPLKEGTGTMLEYIFNETHTGYPTAIGITGDELVAFRAFISTLRNINDDAGDTRDITTDFAFVETDTDYEFCLSKPTTFIIENP